MERVPSPELAEVRGLWTKAQGGLRVQASEAFPLRYRTPACPATYALRSVMLSEAGREPEPTGTEALATVSARPDGNNVSWRLESIRTFFHRSGEREEGPSAAKDLGPALVATDGREWVEMDGPTALWTAASMLPPLVTFHPALPLANETTRAWTLGLHTRQGLKLNSPQMRTRSATVTVDGHALVEGNTRVALVTARWDDRRRLVDPVQTERVEKWVGYYVIAEGGTLLYAALLAGRYQWWSDAAEGNLGSVEVEMSLRDHCSLPTVR